MESAGLGVRVSAAAFALGLGLAVASSPGVALADESGSDPSSRSSDSAGSPASDASGDSAAASTTPDSDTDTEAPDPDSAPAADESDDPDLDVDGEESDEPDDVDSAEPLSDLSDSLAGDGAESEGDADLDVDGEESDGPDTETQPEPAADTQADPVPTSGSDADAVTAPAEAVVSGPSTYARTAEDSAAPEAAALSVAVQGDEDTGPDTEVAYEAAASTPGADGPEPAAEVATQQAQNAALDVEPKSAPAPRNLVTEFLSMLGFAPSAAGGGVPLAPPAFLTAVLELIRREIDRIFFNDAPVAEVVTTGEPVSGTATGLIAASDPEDDPLTYTVTQAPAAGSVTLDEYGGFSYTAGAGLAATGGTDTFVVEVSGGRSGLFGLGRNATSVPVTVTISAPVTGEGTDGAGEPAAGVAEPGVAAAPAQEVDGADGAAGTIYQVSTTGENVVGFDPATDKIDVGEVTVHSFIIVDTDTGVGFRNPWTGDTVVIEGVSLGQLTVDSFTPIANNHLRQDISGALAWEQGIAEQPNTVYARSHEVGQVDVVEFDPATDVVDFRYFATREQIYMTDSASGVVISNSSTGQALILQGVDTGELTAQNFVFHSAQVREDALNEQLGIGPVPDAQVLAQTVPVAGTDDWPTAVGNGTAPNPAAETGTTTVISWQWGTDTALDFDPASDTLDFNWFQADQFDVSESAGSTVIEIVNNEQTYTLNGVALGELQIRNIIALDNGARQKWQALIEAAEPVQPAELPTLSVADAAAAEGDSGTSTMTFTVSLSEASEEQVTVNYATSNGTATAQDYVPAVGTLTFAPGETVKTVDIAVTSDSLVELDEQFTLSLSAADNATIADATATGTVVNDDVDQTPDTLPTVSISDLAVVEGDGEHSHFMFTVALDKASAETVTVQYATADGTASAGEDYAAGSGTVTFEAGVTSQMVHVEVLGDTVVEGDETLAVILSAPSGATLGDATAVGTITDDDVDEPSDTPPAVSIGDVSVVEGNSGSSVLSFEVTLSEPSEDVVTVDYVTSDGTATAGEDYVAAAGTVVFAAGETSRIVQVEVLGDVVVEDSETLTVTLSDPLGATIADGAATGMIVADDAGVVVEDRWGEAFFAPYVDMAGWPVPDLMEIAAENGVSLVVLAFVQADPQGNPAWAGLSALGVDSDTQQAQAINSSIAEFQAAGGDVMLSFGGAAGTTLAQSYVASGKDAQSLADAYGSVIDAYGLNRVDFDIEGAAVADPASIALRSEALALLQQDYPDVEIWYTLPVLPSGLTADGLNVVDSALAAGVELDGVNVMAMDYGESAAPTSGPNAQSMGEYAIEAAESTYAQLSALAAQHDQEFGWNQLGVTPMIGVNDVQTEVFTLADAQALEDFANEVDLGMLSMWSIARDTPGSLGIASPTASGLDEPAASFSNIFNDYGTINIIDLGSGGGETPVEGGTTTTIGWHWGTNTVVAFDPASDKLDFVWMGPDSFEVSEQSGSTVIGIVDNEQTYTLDGVGLDVLQMGNIVALDQGTVTKWQAILAGAVTPEPEPEPVMPTVSIGDASVVEGDSGSSALSFTVTLSQASDGAVAVDYVTADGSALAGEDYLAGAGTVTFAPGVTSQLVQVDVLGDTAVEDSETFTVTLSAPSGATLSDATATGTIVADDVATPEEPGTGEPGNATATVDFVKSSDWGSGFNGDVTVTNTGADTLSDWQVRLDFDGDISSIWNARIVSHDGDTYIIEGAEWNSDVAPAGSTAFGFTAGSGTVSSVVLVGAADPAEPGEPGEPGDPQPSAPQLSVANTAVQEGDSGGSAMVFTVTLSEPADEAVTVRYRTQDFTAAAGSDYEATEGVLTFAAGETAKDVSVTILGDTTYEGNESLMLVLSEVSGAEFATSEGVGLIRNDDANPDGEPEYRVVGYFVEWGTYGRDYQVSDIPADKLTTINYAFADISDDGEVVIYDRYAAVEKNFPGDTWDQEVRGNFNQLAQLKQDNPDLEVLISVGGWTLSDNFSDVAATEQSREKFAESAVDLMVTYGFDGIDLDWEYPVSGGLESNAYRPEDTENYVLLVQEIRDQLDELEATDGADKEYLLTIAGPAGYDKIENYDLAGMATYLDYFTVMTYDLHGAWDSQTGHQAALYSSSQNPDDLYYVDHAIDLYLADVDPSKIVLGSPMYGRTWQGVGQTADGGLYGSATGAGLGTWEPGVIDYSHIMELVEQNPDLYQVYWDDEAKASYVYSTADGGTFITYESIESLQYKLDYIESLGLGGVMFWELDADIRDADDEDSLLGLAARNLLGTQDDAL